MSRFRSRSIRCALACVLAGLVLHTEFANAQTGKWTAPSDGYFYDSASRSIRAISGFVGSAVLGSPVIDGIEWASLAPNRKSALTTQNGSQFWIPDLASPDTSQALDRIPSTQQALWAVDTGQAVILTTTRQLIWLTNFNSLLVPVSSWNLDSSLTVRSRDSIRTRTKLPGHSSGWSLLAADSSANQVLLASYVDESWQLWLASSTVPPVNIPFTGRPVAAAFAQGGSVIVADATGHRIVEIRNLQAGPIQTTLVSSDTYLNDPAAIALSSDGMRLFVADPADNVIRIFKAVTGGADAGAPIAELPTLVPPVSLTNFSPDRFLLNSGGRSGQISPQTSGLPISFLDTGATARVSFVPRER